MLPGAALLFSSVLAAVTLESKGDCPTEAGIREELHALGVSLDMADARMVVTSGKDFVEVAHFDLLGSVRDVRKLQTETACSTRQKAVAVIVATWLIELQKAPSVEVKPAAPVLAPASSQPTPSVDLPPPPPAESLRYSTQLTAGALWGNSLVPEGAGASVSVWKKTPSRLAWGGTVSLSGMAPSALRVTESLEVRYTRAWLGVGGQMRLHAHQVGSSLDLGVVAGGFWVPSSSTYDLGAQGVLRIFSRQASVPVYVQASVLRWFRQQVLETPAQERATVPVWNVQLGLGVTWTFD